MRGVLVAVAVLLAVCVSADYIDDNNDAVVIEGKLNQNAFTTTTTTTFLTTTETSITRQFGQCAFCTTDMRHRLFLRKSIHKGPRKTSNILLKLQVCFAKDEYVPKIGSNTKNRILI